MKKISQRITSDRITAEVSGLRDAPSYAGDFGSGTNWYDVTLKMGRRTLTVPFGMGPALTHEPTAAEVLDCLVSDAAGYDNARDFSDWASEYGYSEDSRKAEQTYRIIGNQSAELRAFLGDKYEAYLYETERL